ncbi:MAG: hypothetical protein ChlgKO_12380 [Chlamydiales bacterium]
MTASLLALFAALSLSGKVLAICQGCVVAGTQTVTYFGILYFIVLAFVISFWRTFPSKPIAVVGLIFSAFIAFFLTLSRQEICPFCITSHILHMAVWSLLLVPCYFRAAALLLTTLLIISVPLVHIKEGRAKVIGKAPAFSFTTKSGKVIKNVPPAPYSALVLHFVQEGCPFCEEQIEEIESFLNYYPNYLFYNVSATDIKKSGGVELIVSQEMQQAFHVNLFPTLIVVDRNGDVIKFVRGKMPKNTTLTQLIANIFEYD